MSESHASSKPAFPRPESCPPPPLDSPRVLYALAILRLDALKGQVATCTPGELPEIRRQILRAKMACGAAFRATRAARRSV